MYDIKQMIDYLVDAILNKKRFYKHPNLIVIGNNSVGKTQLIKGILQKLDKLKQEDIYYIDPQNRIVVDSIDKEMQTGYEDFPVRDIFKTRIKPEYYTKKDVFNDKFTGDVVTYSELLANLGKYSELFEELFGITLTEEEKADNLNIIKRRTIKVNHAYEIESISNSEAAKMRMLMEVNYASEKKCKLVIIDEFDSHFDTDHMVVFMEQLKNKYPKMRFIFVMHNLEALVNVDSMDVAFLNDTYGKNVIDNKVQIFDSDDISQLGQIHRLRTKYIGAKDDTEILLETCVSNVVKYGGLTNDMKMKYDEINRDDLNAKGCILFDYIKERTKDED